MEARLSMIATTALALVAFVGGAQAITKTGTAKSETIKGTNSADNLRGAGGNDTIRAFGGNDRLYGDSGDDVLLGGRGDDSVDGGIGRDRASWYNDGGTQGIVVDLVEGKATRGREIDTLVSIEDVTGTAHADAINGSSAANNIRAAGGDDTRAVRF
jgi:Ca2+-binding RTX toxin-like protein